jgi:uncharacterized protein YcfL
MERLKKILLIMVSIIALMNCQTTKEVQVTGQPPAWVNGEQQIEGMICAVGMSGPTYFRDEAKGYALDDARAELARTLSVNIETIMVEITSDKGSRIDEATVTQMSSWASTVVLENSEAQGYWYDSDGVVTGRKNITFTYVCMPRKFNRKQFEVSLKSTEYYRNNSPEEISREAGDIIMKLEEER